MLKVITLLLLTIFLNGCDKTHDYYFNLNGTYVKADRQKFRVLFTGEVVNCYFTKDNKEYATCDYYKEDIRQYRNIGK